MPGTATSPATSAEVTNISKHGLWLLVNGTDELFLPFDEFPWFKEAPLPGVFNVEQPHRNHFYWPDLDVDLNRDGIEHLEKYPLKSRV